MESSTKYLIFFLILALVLSLNAGSSREIGLKFGSMAGPIIIIYLGYISMKKPVEEKKVEENQPKI